MPIKLSTENIHCQVHTTIVAVPDSKSNLQSAKKAQAVKVVQISDTKIAYSLARNSTLLQNFQQELERPTNLCFLSQTKATAEAQVVAELFYNQLVSTFACELNYELFRHLSRSVRLDEKGHIVSVEFVAFAGATCNNKFITLPRLGRQYSQQRNQNGWESVRM